MPDDDIIEWGPDVGAERLEDNDRCTCKGSALPGGGHLIGCPVRDDAVRSRANDSEPATCGVPWCGRPKGHLYGCQRTDENDAVTLAARGSDSVAKSDSVHALDCDGWKVYDNANLEPGFERYIAACDGSCVSKSDSESAVGKCPRCGRNQWKAEPHYDCAAGVCKSDRYRAPSRFVERIRELTDEVANLRAKANERDAAMEEQLALEEQVAALRAERDRLAGEMPIIERALVQYRDGLREELGKERKRIWQALVDVAQPTEPYEGVVDIDTVYRTIFVEGTDAT